MNPEPDRLFTVEEANALLPWLDETFREIRALREEMEERVDGIKILDALWGERLREPGNPDREEFLAHRAAARRIMGTIEEVVERRIVRLGIRFPPGGLEHGLVDFPTRLESRTVLLCWKWGEDRIRAWHEVNGGFAGRRPLRKEEARRMGRGEPGGSQ